MAHEVPLDDKKKKKIEYIILALSSLIFLIVIYSSFINPSNPINVDYLTDDEVEIVTQEVDLSILDFEIKPEEKAQTIEVNTMSRNPFLTPSWLNMNLQADNNNLLQQNNEPNLNTDLTNSVYDLDIERSKNNNGANTNFSINSKDNSTNQISNSKNKINSNNFINLKLEPQLENKRDQKDLSSSKPNQPDKKLKLDKKDSIDSDRSLPTINDFSLSGTIIDGQKKSAIINGSIIYLNDTINGFQVREIKPRIVILIKDNLTYKVEINE